ncbi:MAG: hypothetical protein V5A62_07890 [Haloarculaceae archaeon]
MPEADDPTDDGSFPVAGLAPGPVTVVVAVLLVAVTVFGPLLSMTAFVLETGAVGRLPPLARAFVLGSGLLFVFVLGFAALLAR